MPAGRSSNNAPSKLSSFHLVVSSLGVVAGIALAVYQIMLPGTSPAPVNVTVNVDPAKLEKPASGVEISKTGEVNGMLKSNGLMTGDGIDLGNARFLAALNDGSDQKYTFRNLFDGKPETAITLGDTDHELNVLVDFGTGTAQPVSAISYSPPVSATGKRAATILDVMVLPDGQMGASGGQLFNFSLQTQQGTQTFSLPPGAVGKGLWLRIAGADGPGNLTIGDISIITARSP